MIVDSLMLRNFGAYKKEVSLDLSGKKVVGIVGANESGKSTLLRAICYALYGKVPLKQDVHKVRDVQLITDGADKDMVVEVGLTVPGAGQITIQRGRTVDNTGFISLDGKPVKLADGQALINEAIRLTYDDFIALSYFVQGDISQFMLGDKSAYFRRWTQPLAMWQALADQFRADTSKLLSQRETVQATKAVQAEMLKDKPVISKRLLAAKKKLMAVSDQLEQAREAELELSGQLQVIKAGEKHTEDVNDRIDDLKDEHDRLNKKLLKALQELEQIKKGMCPLLSVSCKQLAASYEKKRKAFVVTVTGLKEEIKANAKKQQELRKAAKQTNKQPANTDKRNTLKEKIAGVRRSISQLAGEEQHLRAIVTRAETELDRISKAKEAVRTCNKKIKQLESRMKKTRFLYWMCSNKGIPSQILESELEKVETRCNWILSRLDYPKRIRFAAYRELASFEKVCPVCGSEIWLKTASTDLCSSCGSARPRKQKNEPMVTVYDGTQERPFALESGGGQVLQSFAVRLAGAFFVASMLGISIQSIMLDEVFAMLDANNRQKLIGLVIDKLGSEFGLKQQLVVSHHEDVLMAVDDMLFVEKQNGCSIARWM